jgi:hypothetical protein
MWIWKWWNRCMSWFLVKWMWHHARCKSKNWSEDCFNAGLHSFLYAVSRPESTNPICIVTVRWLLFLRYNSSYFACETLLWSLYPWVWFLRKIISCTFSDPNLAPAKYSCATHFVNWQTVGFPTSCFEYRQHCYFREENWNGNWSLDTFRMKTWKRCLRDFVQEL